MSTTTEDWQRAGFAVKGDELERIDDATTDIRPTSRKARGRANLLADDTGTSSQLERTVENGALGEVQAQGGNSGRFLVRVISIRKRLLDEDNLCEKFHVDCCRYARILPKDSPGTTRIEVSQQKAEPGAQEEIKIEIYRLS